MSFEHLVMHYGYPAVMLGTAVEGELILFAGGFVAHSGYLKLEWVMAAAFFGSLMGDLAYFLLGRLRGKGFMKRRPAWKPKVEKVLSLLERHLTLFVIGLRFMSGFRTVTPFALGLTDISIIHFIILDAIGALAWSVAGSFVGYLLGVAARAAGINVSRDEHLIILGMIAVGLVIIAISYLRRKR